MPIETGCTHCGSDQHNTTDCPMMAAAKDQLDPLGPAPLAQRFNEAPAEALRPAAPDGWSKERPSAPGAYYVKGFRVGEAGYRPALVEVARDDDDELVCNIHLSNSNDDLCQWSLLADCSDRFEWLGPLAASPAPEVPGSRPPEQPKPRPYDYQSVPEVAGIGRDTDHPRGVTELVEALTVAETYVQTAFSRGQAKQPQGRKLPPDHQISIDLAQVHAALLSARQGEGERT